MHRLKLTSAYSILKNNFIIIVLFFIINLLIYKGYYILIILDIIYLGYLFIKQKKLIRYLIILTIFLFANLMIRNFLFEKSFQKDVSHLLKVEQIIKTKNNYKIYFKFNNAKVIYYSDEPLQIGGYYNVSGEISKVSTAHYENGFDYYNYLKNNNIIGIIDVKKIQFVKKGFTKFYLNHQIVSYLNTQLDTKAKGMIKALTIGDKDDLDEKLSDSINKIGISHLFVISGLHVNIISAGLLLFINKIKPLKKFSDILVIIILLFYYALSGYLVSVLRVILSYILKILNQKYQFELNNIDLMSINIIMVLLFNPLYAFSYSFILSYTISSSIIVCHKILESKGKFKGLKSSIKVSILSILVTLPIVSMINPTINLLSIIYNILYIPFITYIMLPLSFLTVFLPLIEPAYYYIYILFEKITNIFANIKILNITFPCFNILILLVYYWLLYLILAKIENKQIPLKEGLVFILLLFIWNNICYFNFYDEVYFLDLPKGEATLIKKSFNRCNILIDTGENGYDDILLFLKSKGIKKLDMIIISHSDSDHNGMLEELIEEFKVKEIFYNPYDQKTKNIAISYQIPNSPLNYLDTILIYDITLKIISPNKNYHNTNENSLVIDGLIFNTRYLFTGDITVNVEKELKLENIDILKVAHHGSNTSSSIEFLEKVGFNSPNQTVIAICMNGYKNSFSFPTQNTINKLQDNLYITSYTKTLCIRKFHDKYKIIKL